ncbi:hypothetical protein BHE97_09385 [Aeromicrobium sp. PE09-221]|uniref:class I adenylate-forming enzyme family protein n=1 Tax=Aeromicrobium sp. PE09-221 TaxID=1898043 RepID=UPI000B3ECDF9|nr:class I adenylate-forming enzyme family protein [Aeromicrobium sp. PE09-221]OUZ09674.1 hypothetical protein BHE97_09385 [Aeromicrobium sp. PE09-221]
MDLGTTLTWTAERFPERVAFAGQRRLTYRELDRRTDQIANLMTSLGVERGDRVGLFLSNSEEMASTHLALQKLGVMSTPYNIRLGESELSHCLTDSAPKVVVVDTVAAELARRVLAEAAIRPVVLTVGACDIAGSLDFEESVAAADISSPGIKVGPGDHSVMLYTSGTTGRPKGVPRTQRNEHAASVAHVIQARYQPGEVTLGAMPMYHTMGLRSLLSMIVVGGTFVVQPVFRPDEAVDLIEQESVTALYLVPTAFWSIVNGGGDMDRVARSVRKLAFAGAPMTSSLCEQLVDRLRPEVFINHYGSSEVYTFSIADDAAAKPGSAGRPGVFGRWRVVDPASDEVHEPLPPGQEGEIAVDLCSDEAFSGYWQRPDADAKSIRHGWYHTGDIGRVDEDGDLWVEGRVDDMILTGGENVHPVEVEDILARHPDIAEVSVVGLPDEKWGQAVTAFIVPSREDEDPAALTDRVTDWIRTEAPLSPYKRPKRVIVIGAIPKSPVGKILRRKLVAGEYDAPAMTGPAAESPVTT